MSNDPFGDQQQGGGFVAGLVARLRPSDSPAATSSTPAVQHRRTESEELDDHMAGSDYHPTDVCPRCGYARMSSVYCSVSQTHHGTDKPLNTPRREKRGILARLQEFIGNDGNKSDDEKSDDSCHVRDESSPSSQIADHEESAQRPATPSATGPAAASSSPAAAATTSSWSLFKTKEEKQLDELRVEEEKARKRILDDCMTDTRISEMNIREYSKKVRGDQKTYRHERRDLETACKTAFDVIYRERKDQLEVMQKIYAAELKKTKAEEKAAKKAPPSRDAPNENEGGNPLAEAAASSESR